MSRGDRRTHVGLHARRHARLWYHADRPPVLREALRELLQMREREDERQLEKRRDRKRKHSKRELGATGGRGYTVGELDALIDRGGSVAERSVDAVIAEIGPIDADLRAAAIDELEREREHVDEAAAAWWAAITSTTWDATDWRPGRFVLSPSGLRKLTRVRLLALRGMLALRAGYGTHRLGTIDAWWLVLARPWLADHEIGRVFAAGDGIAPGSHTPEALDRALAEVAESDDELARRAALRWQGLRAAGWGVVRRSSKART